MGFFLACFGFSKKRKRGKSVYRVLNEGQGQGTYEALVDSSLSNNLDIEGNDSIPHSDFGHKLNEQTVKIRKKVRFNLEVKTYEPITADCDDVTSNEEESKQWSITGVCQNHRYYNCRNSYDDEEEELNYEDSDHDEPDYEDCEYYFHSDDELGDDYYSVSDKEDHKGTADDYKARAELFFKKLCNSFVDFHDDSHIDTQAATQRDQNSFKSDLSGIDNRHPLLTPVANLTQWKAIKEKVPQSRDRRKETERARILSRPNVQTHSFQSKPVLAGLAVDASLSSWLNPTK